jgi:tRNA-specific 2-thiouridylase
LGTPPSQNFSCSVKIRYKQKEHAADITVLDDNTVKIVFEHEQKAITPGQAAVLYDGDIVLGGGTIIG